MLMSAQTLNGSHGRTIGADRQLLLPEPWREIFGRDVAITLNPVEREGGLLLWPVLSLEHAISKLGSVPGFDPAARKLRRVFGAGVIASIDRHGRITLPERRARFVVGNTVLQGRGKHALVASTLRTAQGSDSFGTAENEAEVSDDPSGN